MNANQIVDISAHAPRIHIHVQSFGLHQHDAIHDARIAISSPKIFDIVLETSTRLAVLSFAVLRA